MWFHCLYLSYRDELAVFESGLCQLFDIKPSSFGGSQLRDELNASWFKAQNDLIQNVYDLVATES